MLVVHELILCAVTEQWSRYVAYLEGMYKYIGEKAVLSRPPQGHALQPEDGTSLGFEVCFSDSQRIQKLQDTIIRVSHMLDLNLSIFENLVAACNDPFPDPTATGIVPWRRETSSFLLSLSTLEIQTRASKRRTENLLRRLEGSSVLVRSILDAQALEALRSSSRTTAELAALAREDGKKATRSARTLSTITILGFVYLPASFVATLLGTQYITISTSDDGGGVSIHVAREMIILLVLTVILLCVTGGGWLLWERQYRLADQAEEKTGEKMA